MTFLIELNGQLLAHPVLPVVHYASMCIFHDKDYLQDKTNYKERKIEVLLKLEGEVNHSISLSKPLLLMHSYLPGLSLSNFNIGREFTKPVYFNSSQFLEEVDFSEANFGRASFPRTTFQNGATFSEAVFRITDFSSSNFLNNATANFSDATFVKVANFLGVQVNFSEVKFQGEADFFSATLQGEADFSRAKLQGETDFREAKFRENTDFYEATFLEKVNFSNNGFPKETRFILEVFEQPDRIIFNNNNLLKVSFAGSDITRIRFGDKITWGGKKDDFLIIEEEWLQQKSMGTEPSIDVSLELVLSVYRNLRENYEFRLRYDAAGKLFIREMELKRNYREVRENNSYKVKRNGLLRRNLSLTGTYHNLFEYGESLKKPAVTLLLPLFVISFSYFLAINPPSSLDYSGLSHTANIAGRTVEMKNPELSDNIIRMLSLSIFAALFIPLRRRFERRFRH